MRPSFTCPNPIPPSSGGRCAAPSPWALTCSWSGRISTRTWSYVRSSVSSGNTSSRTKPRIHASFSSNSGSVEKSQAIGAPSPLPRRTGSAVGGVQRATTVGAVTTTPVAFRSDASAHENLDNPPPPPQVALSAADRAVIARAETALLDERRLLTGDELAALAALPDGAVMNLAALAHQVRLAWCGPEVEVEGILSAKTGGCPEDCHFCSQSSRFDTPVKATPFLDRDEVLTAARETAE